MNEFWNDFEQFWAANDGWIWIALAIALVVVLAAVLIGFATARKRATNRQEAAAIRADTARRDDVIGRKDSEVRKLEAEADHAQAEADRLHAIAHERRVLLDRERAQQTERLRRAEQLEHGRRHAAPR